MLLINKQAMAKASKNVLPWIYGKYHDIIEKFALLLRKQCQVCKDTKIYEMCHLILYKNAMEKNAPLHGICLLNFLWQIK